KGETPEVGFYFRLNKGRLCNHFNTQEDAVKALLDVVVEHTNADIEGPVPYDCWSNDENNTLSIAFDFPARHQLALATAFNKIKDRQEKEKSRESFLDQLMHKIEEDFQRSAINTQGNNEQIAVAMSDAYLAARDLFEQMSGSNNEPAVSQAKRNLASAVTGLRKTIGQEEKPGQDLLYMQEIEKMFDRAVHPEARGRS
ncbi:MAG: hypothetical protein KGJ06_05885, partial [Pseudomonadota bacterium]|nr:hypothetical protein [Pseudomonadota bacterium]